MGVDYAQGYVFGVPQPLEQVLAGMAQEEPVAVSNLLP
jgi:EAL domain-containing protein (putative c-di-GMP-specific phosphodiesterase class I)